MRGSVVATLLLAAACTADAPVAQTSVPSATSRAPASGDSPASAGAGQLCEAYSPPVTSDFLLRRFNPENGNTRACDLRAQLEPDRPAVGVLLYIYPVQGGTLDEELWLYPADQPGFRGSSVDTSARVVAERVVSFLSSQPTSEHLSLIATVPTHRVGIYDLAYRLSRCSDTRCGGGHSLVLVTAEGLRARELLRIDAEHAIAFEATGGRLTARWAELRASDFLCCPSLERTRIYERSDAGYRLVSDTTTARAAGPSPTRYPTR